MNRSLPLVTIALPVYNGEQWVSQALESLVNQDYCNIEIIVADDVSADDTPIICNEYNNKYDNITFYTNKSNLGGQGNLKNILKQSNGKYFVWASQDDFWDKDFVSVLVAKLEKNKDMVLASGSIEMIDMDKNHHVVDFIGKWNPERLSLYKLVVALLLPVNFGGWLKNNMFLHGVIRTSSLRMCFKLHPSIAILDRSFILFLALQGRWGYVDRVLYHRRTGVGALIRKAKKKGSDKIQELENNIFLPFISAQQMCAGLYNISNITIIVKIYVFIVIILFVLSLYVKNIKRFFLGKGIVVKFIPPDVYNKLKKIKRNRRLKHENNAISRKY